MDQRYYTATAGRFYTPDQSTGASLRNPITWNKYAYAGDDPVNFRDPRGLMMLSTS
jgi:RHS repeat-associated protein